ncbi:MAG: hypothetical protein H0Z24_05555 [Thermosipho sp. (in: Bacteria)]|nr:hypothetical protein [Thermosipho sp. (in: thermotogales)]
MDYKKKSKKQESKVAKEMNGKTTIASGSLYFQKADVRTSDFLIECKTTEKDYYNLKVSTWKKIEKEALKDGMKIPLMQIDLLNGEKRLAVMTYNDFEALGFSKFNFVKSPSFFTKASSAKIKYDFKENPYFNLSFFVNGEYYYDMYEVRFEKERVHLVVIPWHDFLSIVKE